LYKHASDYATSNTIENLTPSLIMSNNKVCKILLDKNQRNQIDIRTLQ